MLFLWWPFRKFQAHVALLFFAMPVMICLLVYLLFMFSPTHTFRLPISLEQVLPSYLQTDNSGWWPPEYKPPKDSGYGGGDWNILYHLGGNGPWIEKVDGVVDGSMKVPGGCEVDMVHMMSRHGERYPTKTAGLRMIKLVERIKKSGRKLVGSLAFVNDWEYILNDPDQQLEQLTTTGPYSGVLEAFTTGVKLFTRYSRLRALAGRNLTYVWASDSNRVIDTARHFSAGFFGLDDNNTKLFVVSEAEDNGGDTLTPGNTCKKYVHDIEKGHQYGYEMLYKYRATYLGTVSERLGVENPGFGFTDEDVYSMQETCGFETIVRGRSPWCDVFNHTEWSQFEYARDIIHFYRSGPGNKYARSLGWLWLNATTNLLLEGPSSAGPLYFTFVHDGDVVPMLAALGLFEDSYDLPIDRIGKERLWKTSQITPMGGRIIFERLSCRSSSSSHTEEPEIFVRFNVNDGIVALKGCSDGPGSSCSLPKFVEHIRQRGKEAGDFRTVCDLPKDSAEKITFLRQPGFGGEG